MSDISVNDKELSELETLRQRVSHLEESEAQHKKAGASLKYLNAFSQLINPFYSRFININYNEIDVVIKELLKAVAEYLGFDSCYLIEFTKDKKSFDYMYVYVSDKVEVNKDYLKSKSASNYPNICSKIIKGEAVQIVRQGDKLSDAKLADSAIVLNEDLNSIVFVPLINEGWAVKGLGLESKSKKNVLSDESIELLVGVGEIISCALERKNTEKIISDIQSDILNDVSIRSCAIVNSAVDGIIAIDEDGIIELFNQAAGSIYGYSPAEIVGKNITMLAPQDHTQEYANYLSNISFFTKRRAADNLKRTIGLRKDGSTFPLEISLTELVIKNRRSYTIIARDITSIQELEAKLWQSQKLEALGTLAGGVAHDFNNLLMVINGYCDMLTKKLEGDEKLVSHVNEIKKAGEKAVFLTRQLLAFSKKRVTQPEILDINKTISDLGKMLNRLITENVEIVTDLDEKVYNVKLDPAQFEQIVINLIVSARDKMREGGTIKIITKNVELDNDSFIKKYVDILPGTYVMFMIKDDGEGIDKETISKIFAKSFDTKEPHKGADLGFSAVYGIVKQNSGYMMVSSKPGKGTTVNIYFPKAEKVEEHLEAAEHAVKTTEGVETIFLVEDTKTVRTIIRETLSSAGYDVVEAENGQIALQAIEETDKHIDLLITDMIMPKMGGKELAEKLREKLPNLKIIFMSGYLDNEILDSKILKDKNVKFIEKPCPADVLRSKIRKLLDR